MTENLAGRGEGLAGLRRWANIGSPNGLMQEHPLGEFILRYEALAALEAAAPAGTARVSIESLPTYRGTHCMNSSEYLLKDDVRAALATPSPQAPPEQGNAFSTTSAREQSAATAASNIAVSVGLAIYARMVRLSHDSNQAVGEKRDYYVTLRQLEEAFIQMRDEVRQ